MLRQGERADREPGRGSPGGLQLSLSNPGVVLAPGETFTFSATVTGASSGQSSGVTWAVQEGAAGGTIDANGKYTAPETEGTYHVVATSVADPR